MWCDMFYFKLGDIMCFSIGEVSIDVIVSSVCEVDWSLFWVNFFLLLDVDYVCVLLYSYLGSFYLLCGCVDVLVKFFCDYVNFSLIDVDVLFDCVCEIVDWVSNVVCWIFGFSLFVGVLVLVVVLVVSVVE